MQLKQGEPGGLSFIATGSMVRTAMDIANTSYVSASVWSAPFIKPAKVDQVKAICQHSSAVVTMEEHSIYGGLGSMIAEIASEYCPVRILRIGVRDRFSEHCGTYDYLLKEHGLDRGSIEKQLTEFLAQAV